MRIEAKRPKANPVGVLMAGLLTLLSDPAAAAEDCRSLIDHQYVVMEISRFDAGLRRELTRRSAMVLDRRGARDFIVAIPRGQDPVDFTTDVASALGMEASSPPVMLVQPDARLGMPEKVVPAILRAVPDERIQVLIGFYDNVTASAAGCVAEKLDSSAEVHAPRVWRAVTTRGLIDRLHPDELSIIRRIEQGPATHRLLNDLGRQAANTDDALQLCEPPHCATRAFEVSGEGVNIAIADAGINGNHKDLKNRMLITRAVSGNRIHGTHVASVATGDGSADGSLHGHAPGAGIGDYPTMGTDITLFDQALSQDGMDVVNHSYELENEDGKNAYRLEHRTIDEYVRSSSYLNFEVPAAPHVYSAGFCPPSRSSSGMCLSTDRWTPTNAAKNPLLIAPADTIGCTDPPRQCARLGSGLGPTIDGRIKPDLIAPGCNDSKTLNQGIRAARGDTTDGYTKVCSASTAAPVVTGVIAVMMEQAERNSVQITLPSTYKAILIQTAVDQTGPSQTGRSKLGFHPGPDGATGWGLVDADRAVTLAGNGARWLEAGIENQESEVFERCFYPETGEHLAVTLAWDDPPGTAYEDMACAAIPVLKNDLDLKLLGPGDVETFPWTLRADSASPYGYSAFQDQPDRLNNVEKAEAVTAVGGEWRLRVNASLLPEPQRFSLAASHDLETCPPKQNERPRRPTVLPPDRQ